MTLSLRTWLVLALVLIVGVPALAFAGAWALAGRWQTAREKHRYAAAVRLLDTAPSDSDTAREKVAAQLEALGVEGQVSVGAFPASTDAVDLKRALATAPEITTPGLLTMVKTGVDKQHLERDYVIADVHTGTASGTLFVRRESAAARLAIAMGAAAVALAAVLALAVGLLRRWVLRPLARLAAEADRIAGGDLAIEPVASRAREVAQVGDALHGMAGGLSDALGASAAAERERRFLVTAIAHDLRTPLFILRGSLEAAELGMGDGHLARAQAKAAHLDRLVDGLFAVSRAEYAGGGDELVDVAALVRQAGAPVDAPGPVLVRGDGAALQRILTNLLDNADRHGGGVEFVRITNGDRVRVEVADAGPGFAAEELPYVFEPLYRGNGAPGSGIGLAIARRLARAHGGDIAAANREGGGAVVTLELVPAR